VTVHGSNLDSVAEPFINLTVVVTRFDSDMNVTSITAYTRIEVIA